MADEQQAPAPDPQEGTPEEQAPVTPDSQQGTPGQEDVNWEQRYKDLQSEWTPQQQELAQLRQFYSGLQDQDPETVQAVMGHLGLEYAEPEPEEFQDPNEVMAQRLAALEQVVGQGQEQSQVQEAMAQDMAYMNQALEAFEGDLGRQFTEEELHLIVPHAVANPNDDGSPGIEGAIQLWNDVQEAQQQQWAQTKRTSTPAGGQEGVEMPDLDASHSDRVARMMSQLAADQAAS